MAELSRHGKSRLCATYTLSKIVEVQAQQANRDKAEEILRDIVNKYKRGGKQIWLSKNPKRALEYRKLQAAIKQEANNDILKGFQLLN